MKRADLILVLVGIKSFVYQIFMKRIELLKLRRKIDELKSRISHQALRPDTSYLRPLP